MISYKKLQQLMLEVPSDIIKHVKIDVPSWEGVYCDAQAAWAQSAARKDIAFQMAGAASIETMSTEENDYVFIRVTYEGNTWKFWYLLSYDRLITKPSLVKVEVFKNNVDRTWKTVWEEKQ